MQWEWGAQSLAARWHTPPIAAAQYSARRLSDGRGGPAGGREASRLERFAYRQDTGAWRYVSSRKDAAAALGAAPDTDSARSGTLAGRPTAKEQARAASSALVVLCRA